MPICDLCLDLDNIEISKQRTQTFLTDYEKVYPLTDYEIETLKIFLKCHQAISILETKREKIEENNTSDENLKFLDKAQKGLNLMLKYDFIENNPKFKE